MLDGWGKKVKRDKSNKYIIIVKKRIFYYRFYYNLVS